MEHLKMQTSNKADEHYKKLAETTDENGEVVRAIDKDNLSTDKKLNRLAEKIGAFIENSKNNLAFSINSGIVKTYWSVGKYIVEFEQDGNAKAQYGTSLLTKLAKLLTLKIGKGYSRPNLNNMRKFYVLYPNLSDMSDKFNRLSWSHICEIIKIDDALERNFYINECISENWNVRSLRRQMDSALYLRLAASKDKQGILELANKGVVVQKAEDVVKDTYTLEFLGLPEKIRYSEKDLENRIFRQRGK